MTTKFKQYLHQSMAATGFCIVNGGIAASLRPDLWPNGNECSGDFMAAKKHGFDAPHGAQAYLLRVKGHSTDLHLLARNHDQLAQRIEWVTGKEVQEVIPMRDLQGVPDAPATDQEAARPSNGDLYEGVTTAEAGRTCASCEHASAGHTCKQPERSGIAEPSMGVLRRCPAFQPHYHAIDRRNGAALWPELVSTAQIAATLG